MKRVYKKKIVITGASGLLGSYFYKKFKNNKFDVAVFNKKKEYNGAFLYIDDTKNDTKLNYLIGINNNIIKNKKALSKKVKNKVINDLFY